MHRSRIIPLLALTFVLAACGGSDPSPNPKPTGDLFKGANAWTGALPADAQTGSSDAFSKGVASGELALMSGAAVEAQKAARDGACWQRLWTCRTSRATVPSRGRTMVLFGLGTRLHNAAEEYRRSQSVENALSSYALTYDLLPGTLKGQAPTPDSLKGKGLAEGIA